MDANTYTATRLHSLAGGVRRTQHSHTHTTHNYIGNDINLTMTADSTACGVRREKFALKLARPLPTYLE